MGFLIGILIMCVFGAIVGWLAGLVVKGSGFGLVGDIIIGIVGANLAGWLFPCDWNTGRQYDHRRNHRCGCWCNYPVADYQADQKSNNMTRRCQSKIA